MCNRRVAHVIAAYEASRLEEAGDEAEQIVRSSSSERTGLRESVAALFSR